MEMVIFSSSSLLDDYYYTINSIEQLIPQLTLQKPFYYYYIHLLSSTGDGTQGLRHAR
jgi:hypothetical protein